MAKRRMSTRCRLDTSREIRQWIGTVASLAYTIGVVYTIKPISGLKTGAKKICRLVMR